MSGAGSRRRRREAGTMEQIDALHRRLIQETLHCDGDRAESRSLLSEIHYKLIGEIDEIRKEQQAEAFGSKRYQELDCALRLLLLKEIQIIIDAYHIAMREGDTKRWKSMYGDIEHYKREFYYYRMGQDYRKSKKSLQDYRFIEETG